MPRRDEKEALVLQLETWADELVGFVMDERTTHDGEQMPKMRDSAR